MVGGGLRPRFLGGAVTAALADTRIVVLEGARQVGKSTLAKMIAGRLGGLVVTADLASELAGARADPAGYAAQRPGGLEVIDEIQRAPELLLALKAEADQDPAPGRFLVTGSADLLGLKFLRDRLGGRFAAGLVLCTGGSAAPFGSTMAAVPPDALWS
jgi:predicted AAA+ superfamily ATPase